MYTIYSYTLAPQCSKKRNMLFISRHLIVGYLKGAPTYTWISTEAWVYSTWSSHIISRFFPFAWQAGAIILMALLPATEMALNQVHIIPWVRSRISHFLPAITFCSSEAPYSNATNSFTGAPGLAAPGLRDPKAYQLLTGYATLDFATAVPDDAAVDFFNNPTSAHLNRGFYSGTGKKNPTCISRFDDSSISGWTVTGTASIVADPSGGLGKSLSLASGVSITRLILSLFRSALMWESGLLLVPAHCRRWKSRGFLSLLLWSLLLLRPTDKGNGKFWKSISRMVLRALPCTENLLLWSLRPRVLLLPPHLLRSMVDRLIWLWVIYLLRLFECCDI